MCWMCDHPGATIQDALDNVRAKIRKHGWAVQYVEPEKNRASFAYTIGLQKIGLPELVITGLEPLPSLGFLDQMVGEVLCGFPLRPGSRVDVSPDLTLEVVDVEHPDAHLCYAVAIEGPIAARQLVWSDPHGLMPWERGFAHGRVVQPVLGARDVTPHPD